MNFFSHAVIAARRSENPRWILGSMLPDFLTMAGLRLDSINNDNELKRGLEFHHSCDQVFHRAPLVNRLMSTIKKELIDDGLNRGSAMAVGHVGLELLLDGSLVASGYRLDAYQAAIAEIKPTEKSLRFIGPNEEQSLTQWRNLGHHLPTAAIPEGYSDPNFVADRLIRILVNRPRLAVPKEQKHLVHTGIHRAAPAIFQQASLILAEVENQLGKVSY